MGKIIPGVTPEDEFRKAINEAGGNVQINTTPANLLKALKDIGGEVSYGSGDVVIVPTVNEGGKDFGPGDFDIELEYGNVDSSFVWFPFNKLCDRIVFMKHKSGIYINSKCIRLGAKGDARCFFKDNYFQLWINDVKVPNKYWYIHSNQRCLGVADTDNVIYNLLKSDGLFGAKIRLKWKSGVFYKGYGDNIQYCTADDVTFNYMDNFNPYSPIPQESDMYVHSYYKANIGSESATFGNALNTKYISTDFRDSIVYQFYSLLCVKEDNVVISILNKDLGWLTTSACKVTLDYDNAKYKIEGTININGVNRRFLVQISDSIPEYNIDSSGNKYLVKITPFNDKVNTQVSVTIYGGN